MIRSPALIRTIIAVLVMTICIFNPFAKPALAAPDPGIDPTDRALVEHSAAIFVGKIDIVTDTLTRESDDEAPAFATRYTVLISQVVKGSLEPQQMLVVEQAGGNGDFVDGDAQLVPGADYLMFTSYIPGERVYAITTPLSGNQPAPDAERLEYWREIAAQTRCEFDDVLVYDDVIYQRRNWNEDKRYLNRELVGASIATVRLQDTAANACRSDQANLTATSAPAGTKIQAVKGYEPAFRVVLRLPDNHRYLYEAVRNDSAATGANLLDLTDRVVEIEAERWSDCDDLRGTGSDCPADVRGTSTDEEIDTIVELVLDAPVKRDSIDLYDRVGKYLRVEFILDDGSTVEVTGSLLTGLTANGIELPIDGIILMLWGG